MQQADVLIVGGGPAGSTCAARLRAGGLDVLVLDKAEFPRPKLCAGWITPAVLDELALDRTAYAQNRVLQPMTGFRVGRIGGQSLTVFYPRPVSFGIRRNELDEYLLRRSTARLALGEAVETIRRSDGHWIVNERHRAPMLVAAGGHFCPVARLLEGDSPIFAANQAVSNGQGPSAAKIGTVPSRGPLIACQEFEVALSETDWLAYPIDPAVPEIYFCEDLLGYGWCIRKGNYLNVGLGRADRQGLPGHVARFCEFLRREGRIPGPPPGRFFGHAYLLYEQSGRPLLDDGVVWVGDAAGLAYPASGEGIRPAVESALIAADVILAAGGDYRRECLEPYRRRLEARFGPRPVGPPIDRPPSAIRRRIARWLLGRPWFVRRVVLDRWFLHSNQPALAIEAGSGLLYKSSSIRP